MIEHKERTIVQKYRIFSCDHPGCTVAIEDPVGCCGISPIMSCNFCGKDLCRTHREVDYDNTSDYPILTSCLSKKCATEREIWLSNYYEEELDNF